jgi:hypothetical protein
MGDLHEKMIQKLQFEVVLLSLALLVGAMLWTWQIGMAANKIEHGLSHVTDDLKVLRRTVKELEARHA